MLNAAESITAAVVAVVESTEGDTTPAKKGGSAKKAFTFSRNSIWAVDPLAVSIRGFKAHEGVEGILPEEFGELDTDDTDDDLYREDLAQPVDPVFVDGVRKFWVQDPILIAKVDGQAVVVEGRTRIRTARRINAERAKEGLPPLKVEAKQAHDHLVERMILANNARKVVVAEQKLKDARMLLSSGYTEEDVATTLHLNLQQLRDLLAYGDSAPEVKEAVKEGVMSLTAGIEFAKAPNLESQRAAVAAAMQSIPGKITVTGARRAVRSVTRAPSQGDGVGIVSKKIQKALLAQLETAEGLDPMFVMGGCAVLRAILGVGELDSRLVALLSAKK